MDKLPLISVIIPVYNVRTFLKTCIDSVCLQSYLNLEIILIDDGSTDDSGYICDDYANKDIRIKVVHKSNGGLSDARNVGIDIARGDYITFIDSDDFILPEYIDYLYNLIFVNNADISVCQLIEVDECNFKIGDKGVSVDKVITGNIQCMEDFLKDTAIDTTAWRKLYKKSLFSNGVRYPIGKYHEDVFTTYKLIAQCTTIAVGSKALYAYRKRSGSIVNSSFSPQHMDVVVGNLERYRFIAKNYPMLEGIASKSILYAANVCVMRIGKSHIDPMSYIPILQPLYRKFIIKYLRSNSKFKSKIFAMFACIKLKILIKLISSLSK